ncbi:carbohydrate-binding module family 50 protein, partial [Serendipita vermifera MAFF 305830]
MALTLVSILALATTAVVAAPLPQNEGVTPCKFTYYSQPGDTCRSIGLSSGYYDTDILAANSFLDCSNIWPNTPVCIPDIPYPVTVTYPTPTGPTPIPLPTPVCQANIKSVAGDTCDSIAEPYHMSGGNILAANTFLNCDDI